MALLEALLEALTVERAEAEGVGEALSVAGELGLAELLPPREMVLGGLPELLTVAALLGLALGL